MLKRYVPFLAMVALVISCSKDKLSTKPSIEVKSINGTEFTPQQEVLITLSFKDKEGDLGTGTLTYIRNRLNVFYPVINNLVDSVTYALPEFPKTTSGDIKLTIPAGFLS